MNNKNVLLSFVLIFCLVIFIFLKSGLFDRKENNIFTNNEIDKFCINNYCLEKNNNVWFVVEGNNKDEAKVEMIKIYLDKFKKISTDDLISTNPSKLNSFGLGDNEKLIMKIDNKKIEIGNVGGSFDQTYFRKENENTVYLTKVTIDKNLIMNIDYWKK